MQLELSFNGHTKADQDEVARLTRWLYTSGDRWVPAKEILETLGFSDRKVRILAAASRGYIVSSPGSPGYKHVKHCDPEEVRTTTGRLDHQAKLMSQRACEIRTAFHSAA